MRLRLALKSAAVDLNALIATLPALAERWRALAFADGAAVVNGVPTPRLTTIHGVHPQRGVQYRIAVPDPAQTWLVEVVHDDSMRLQLQLTEETHHQTIDVALHRPKRPDRLEVTASVDAGGGWFGRGLMKVEAQADLAALDVGHPRRPQITAKVTHPRLRGHITIALDTSEREEWTTSVEGVGSGRGVLRPAVALAGPVARLLVARYARRIARDFAKDVDSFNADMASQFGAPASPEKIAESVLKDFLNSLTR